MSLSFHSVRLIEEECKGCTNCIKHCPTEAIRVYQGKARIRDELCIDCGECIRHCPNHAKQSFLDEINILNRFRYRIALLAPSFFGQFPQNSVEQIHAALKLSGFSSIAHVGRGAEYVSLAVHEYLKQHSRRPLISSACPTVVRLIQIRYEELIENIVPIESPMEIAATMAKEALRKKGYPDGDVGAVFISPCPAKSSVVKQPFAREKSAVDGVLGMRQVYGLVLNALSKDAVRVGDELGMQASQLGMAWGSRGGELQKLPGMHLSVDGIYNVLNVLEELDMGRLNDVDFIEMQACPGGCVGGPLTVQNGFVAKAYLDSLCSQLPKAPSIDYEEFMRQYRGHRFHWENPLQPRSVLSMDEDISRALVLIQQQEMIAEKLPGLDCGSCGSPTCQSLAEDIARGLASENDCIFRLRESLQHLSEELWDLVKQVPPTLAKQEDEKTREPKEGSNDDHN